MNKTAQTRGVLNELREKINMPGSYIDKFFKPELDRVMSSLKELDDRIRAVLTGKTIGQATPPDAIAAKDLLKSARTNFNRREYMAGVADLGHFHKKMWDITSDINKFFVDVNKIHHKFLFEGLPDEYKNNITQLREHMDKLQRKASLEALVKEAGIMDFFYNIGTKRGRSLAAWEKRYPKQTEDLRKGGDRLINEAQKLLDNTISYLKAMATSRATRRPDEYIDIANKIKSDFDKFDSSPKGFRNYYETAIVPWLKIKDEIEANEQNQGSQTPAIIGPNAGKVELGITPPEVSSEVLEQEDNEPQTLRNMPVAPTAIDQSKQLGQLEKIHGPDTLAPNALRNPPIEQDSSEIKADHIDFYNSLQAFSKEDPSIIAKYICKYATFIQKTDLDTAIELFTIARNIKG
jgi:hypothetical protein